MNNEIPLELHKRLRGKISIESTFPIKNRHDLALVYTPGVGDVSTYLGQHPEEVRNYTWVGNTVAIISDGSAVLGLGNIGPAAVMPVLEGKAAILRDFAGVNTVPLALGTQDTQEIINTVRALAPSFAGIILEDISAPRCFEIEDTLKAELDIPVIHDDQHGTAIAVLAGLTNAIKVSGKDQSVRIIISGAGAAGVAITKLLAHAGFPNICVLDSKGTLHADRTDLDAVKMQLAELAPCLAPGDLSEALRGTDVFIGVSKGGILTSDMVRIMNPDPIIFALANPVPEIGYQEGKDGGALVVATGRSDFPNQINNALVFPGLIKGMLEGRLKKLSPDTFIAVAHAIAGLVEPTPDQIVPDLFDERLVPTVANAVIHSLQ